MSGTFNGCGIDGHTMGFLPGAEWQYEETGRETLELECKMNVDLMEECRELGAWLRSYYGSRATLKNEFNID